MKFSPFEYQKLAIGHLLANRSAGLFMGCGLGKTSSTLAAVEALFDDLATKGILVVAPVRVCNLTWDSEAAKWEDFRWMRVANLRTKEGWRALEDSSAHVYTCNYEMLPKLQKLYFKGRRKKKFAFDTIVFDESTRAKNPDSSRIKSVREYLWRHDFRIWALTGEPTPNSLLEIFGQILLVDGGRCFGKSFAQFRDRYFETKDYAGRKWEPKPHAREAILRRISDICLTLRSSEFLDVPDVSIEDVEVALSSKVREQYETMKEELFLEIGEECISAANAAVLCNKLSQITSGACYGEGKELIEIHSKKLEALRKVAKEEQGPLFVICHFRHEQDRIRKCFPEAVFFEDATTLDKQKKLEQDWSNGKIKMLVANPQSVGHGLNLQYGGKAICWFTCTWSGEFYTQTNHRLYRTGQKEIVKIYRLVATDTIDDYIVETLRHKNDQQAEFLLALQKMKNRG